MRVTSVSILSEEVEAIRFDLRSTTAKSQYIIRNIAGLDADEIIPKFYGFSKDGTKRFYDFKLRQRELVLRIVMNPNYRLGETNSDIRDNVYRAISATRSGLLDLDFHSGGSTVARISGHITKFEAAYFSNEPELQITIQCNDPVFRGITPVILGPSDIPDANPIIIADDISTAPHGFSMKVSITGTLADFTIQDKAADPEWDFKIIPATSFLSGDDLYFSSEFNDRYLYMIRSGVTTHLLDRIEPTSVWPTIFPGGSQFHFSDIASFDWDNIEFHAAYWGV
jgi:hypothetical protein